MICCYEIEVQLTNPGGEGLTVFVLVDRQNDQPVLAKTGPTRPVTSPLR